MSYHQTAYTIIHVPVKNDKTSCKSFSEKFIWRLNGSTHVGAAPEQGDSGSSSTFSINLPSSRLHRSLCAGTGSRAVTYTEKQSFLFWQLPVVAWATAECTEPRLSIHFIVCCLYAHGLVGCGFYCLNELFSCSFLNLSKFLLKSKPINSSQCWPYAPIIDLWARSC